MRGGCTQWLARLMHCRMLVIRLILLMLMTSFVSTQALVERIIANDTCYHLANSKGTTKCYTLLSGNTRNWQSSIGACRQKGWEPAKVEAPDTHGTLVAIMQRHQLDSLWISAKIDKNSWYWTGATTEMALGSYTAWRQGHPVSPDLSDLKDCVMSMSYLGFPWEDKQCAFDTGFICQAEVGDKLCNNWRPLFDEVVYVNDVCLLVSNQHLSFFKARTRCEELGTHLVHVRDEATQMALQRVTTWRSSFTQGYWIGLTRTRWLWHDGEEVSLSFWEASQPSMSNADCAILKRFSANSYFWANWNCADQLPFVCVVDMTSTSTSSTSVLSTEASTIMSTMSSSATPGSTSTSTTTSYLTSSVSQPTTTIMAPSISIQGSSSQVPSKVPTSVSAEGLSQKPSLTPSMSSLSASKSSLILLTISSPKPSPPVSSTMRVEVGGTSHLSSSSSAVMDEASSGVTEGTQVPLSTNIKVSSSLIVPLVSSAKRTAEVPTSSTQASASLSSFTIPSSTQSLDSLKPISSTSTVQTTNVAVKTSLKKTSLSYILRTATTLPFTTSSSFITPPPLSPSPSTSVLSTITSTTKSKLGIKSTSTTSYSTSTTSFSTSKISLSTSTTPSTEPLIFRDRSTMTTSTTTSTSPTTRNTSQTSTKRQPPIPRYSTVPILTESSPSSPSSSTKIILQTIMPSSSPITVEETTPTTTAPKVIEKSTRWDAFTLPSLSPNSVNNAGEPKRVKQYSNQTALAVAITLSVLAIIVIILCAAIMYHRWKNRTPRTNVESSASSSSHTHYQKKRGPADGLGDYNNERRQMSKPSSIPNIVDTNYYDADLDLPVDGLPGDDPGEADPSDETLSSADPVSGESFEITDDTLFTVYDDEIDDFTYIDQFGMDRQLSSGEFVFVGNTFEPQWPSSGSTLSSFTGSKEKKPKKRDSPRRSSIAGRRQQIKAKDIPKTQLVEPMPGKFDQECDQGLSSEVSDSDNELVIDANFPWSRPPLNPPPPPPPPPSVPFTYPPTSNSAKSILKKHLPPSEAASSPSPQPQHKADDQQETTGTLRGILKNAKRNSGVIENQVKSRRGWVSRWSSHSDLDKSSKRDSRTSTTSEGSKRSRTSNGVTWEDGGDDGVNCIDTGIGVIVDERPVSEEVLASTYGLVIGNMDRYTHNWAVPYPGDDVPVTEL